VGLEFQEERTVPNTLSAKKRVRQNARSRALNLWRKRRIKEQVRSFLNAVETSDVKAAEEEYRKTCGLLDKVASTRTIHPNAAARKKSRLARRLNGLKQQKKG
jgi:small subunit ribosomal protein S20